jgi:ATP synthase F1 gamma subunit
VKRPQDVAEEERAMGSIVQLTGAYEGIASIHIARLRGEVTQSNNFFRRLWSIYTQLRIGKEFHFGRDDKAHNVIDKELFIIVTSEGSLSGDIDQRLIDQMLKGYSSAAQDIIVIGRHGSTLLTQQAIMHTLAQETTGPNAEPDVEQLVQQVQSYRTTRVYYQEYVSLMVQEIRQIDLSTAVQERGDKLDEGDAATDAQDAYISDLNYIFEPSVPAVVDHMERSMLGVVLNEAILASKLAQQASRFRAMSAARIRADESHHDLKLQLSYVERSFKDERMREIINGLRQEVS